ncbi:MAG: radical SAM protein, partial [Nitrospirae bacterium]
LRCEYGVWGDGEDVLPELIYRLNNNSSIEDVPGLVLRGIIKSPNRIKELRKTDVRALSWIDIKRYIRKGANYPVQTKRGCTKKCLYCTYYTIEGVKGRFKEAKDVAEEVLLAKKYYRPKVIEFVDSTFNLPKEHAIDVCEALIERKIGLEFEASGINPADVSEELFLSMKRANFNSAIITPDSASEPVLKGLNKGFSVKDVVKTAEYTKKAGIPVLWSFLMGGPNEDENTIRETFRFIREETSSRDVAFVGLGVRIYPNTQMARRAVKEGIIKEDEDLLEPKFYFSPDRETLIRLIKEEAKGIKNIITVADNQHPIVEILTPLVRLLGLPGPLWRYSRWLRTLHGILS